MSVRRTNLPIAGPGKARVLGPSTINAPNQPTCSARYPQRGAGAALVLPACNTEAMQLHLDEIATKVTPGAHAVLILDQAGWHGAKDLKAPKNISLLPLPPRAPELDPQENIWQFMRANWLSNRFQILRRNRRPLLLRVEHAHRSTLENHVHRSPRLGSRRSIIVRVGITAE